MSGVAWSTVGSQVDCARAMKRQVWRWFSSILSGEAFQLPVNPPVAMYSVHMTMARVARDICDRNSQRESPLEGHHEGCSLPKIFSGPTTPKTSITLGSDIGYRTEDAIEQAQACSEADFTLLQFHHSVRQPQSPFPAPTHRIPSQIRDDDAHVSSPFWL